MRSCDKVMKISLRSFRRISDFELYIYQLIDMIENREDIVNKIKLEGYLLFHSRTCLKALTTCSCRSLLESTIREEESNQRTKLWYQLIKHLLKEGVDRF